MVYQTPWPEGVSFLHDDRERGINIRLFTNPVRFQRVFNEKGSMLQYAQAIENAPEIHVIDSSFYHLTECLNPTGKLFLHRYARFYCPGFHDIPARHKWEIIDDPLFREQANLILMLRGAM